MATLHTCTRRFFSQIASYSTSVASNKKSWTPQETKKLLDLVKKHGKQWAVLEEHFPDRNRSSLSGRYYYMYQKFSGNIENINIEEACVKNNWTPKEDALLVSLYYEHGPKWNKILEHFPGRCSSTIAQRYQRIKTKEASALKSGPWSEADSTKLLSLTKLYDKDWEKIASKMQTRTMEQCKARYHYIRQRTAPAPIEVLDSNRETIRQALIEDKFDFAKVIRDHSLPVTVPDLQQYYRRELDEGIQTTPWSDRQLQEMMQLYGELHSMELVQPRLSVKRGLRDMWKHYHHYKTQQQRGEIAK